jgi:biotin carboxylase
MHEDAILIVCGGLLQVPAVRIAKEMGLKVIVTDINPNALCMKMADEPVVLDIYDEEGHVQLVDKLKSRYNLLGVFTEGANAEVTVAAAAKAAGLPGIPVESARKCKNKNLMRRAFDEHGLEQIKWAEPRSEEQAVKMAEKIGFPLVVKPADNTTSRGMSRVFRSSDLPQAYRRATAASKSGGVVLEEMCAGPEQSVEIIFDESGSCQDLNIVDRLFAYTAYSVETGHVNPTSLDEQVQSKIYSMARRAAGVVGVRFGVFKADTMVTRDGPAILEVTARLSGGFDCQSTTPLSSGRNFIKAAMHLAVGKKIDPEDLRRKWFKHSACVCPFPRPGVIKKITGVQQAMSTPGVKEVYLRFKEGDVIPEYTDGGTRPAFVISQADTREQAIKAAETGRSLLKFETVEAEKVEA